MPESKKINEHVQEHEKWLKQNGEEGKRLHEKDLPDEVFRDKDLSGRKLRKAILPEMRLRETDLQGADLREVNLKRARLRKADFSDANLKDAKLENADLTSANFEKAKLQNVKLSDATGLQVQKIAQAHASNADLPDNVVEFTGLKTIEEATRGARKLFIALGLACVYSALAISTTSAGGKDPLSLPFINQSVSLWVFYMVVPVLLALGLGYFHLQMERLWEEISRLPAVFPDGKRVDQKIHPWIITTGLVRAHFPHLKKKRTPYFRWQKLVVITLAWGAVPATQVYFVGSFIIRFPESVNLSAGGAFLTALTVAGAVVSYQTSKAQLRGEYEGPLRPFTGGENEHSRKLPEKRTVFSVIAWMVFIFILWGVWICYWDNLTRTCW